MDSSSQVDTVILFDLLRDVKMSTVKNNGVLSRRNVCGTGLYGAALVLTGCGGGGGGGDASPAANNGGSTGAVNGGLTGTMYYSFTSRVKTVDLAAGNEIEITGKTAGTPPRLPYVFGAPYFELSADSKTLFFISDLGTDGVVAVDIAGNTAKTLFAIDRASRWGEIRLSPDGKNFAMVQGNLGDNPGVYIFDTSGNQIGYYKATKGASNSVCWTPDNRLLFTDDGFYLTNPGNLKNSSRISTITSANVSISPAGDKIAFASLGHIWMMGIKGDNAVQVTTGDNVELQPRWSPNGKHIVLQSYVKGTNAVGGIASVTSLYYLAAIPADGKQYTLKATGPTGSGGGHSDWDSRRRWCYLASA
jgi:WD40-like Beta Propeller Repeat